MNLLELSLISSAFLCSLITGFILIFAIVVMPGISRFEDKEFLKAFQLIDGIIQNNQPIFLLIWLGSCLLYTSPSPRDVEESRMPSSA